MPNYWNTFVPFLLLKAKITFLANLSLAGFISLFTKKKAAVGDVCVNQNKPSQSRRQFDQASHPNPW